MAKFFEIVLVVALLAAWVIRWALKRYAEYVLCREHVLELGQGETLSRRKRIGQEGKAAVQDGLVGTIPVGEITARGEWTVRVVVRDKPGAQRESRATLAVG